MKERVKVKQENGVIQLEFLLDRPLLNMLRSYLKNEKDVEIDGVLDLETGRLILILIPDDSFPAA